MIRNLHQFNGVSSSIILAVASIFFSQPALTALVKTNDLCESLFGNPIDTSSPQSTSGLFERCGKGLLVSSPGGQVFVFGPHHQWIDESEYTCLKVLADEMSHEGARSALEDELSVSDLGSDVAQLNSHLMPMLGFPAVLIKNVDSHRLAVQLNPQMLDFNLKFFRLTPPIELHAGLQVARWKGHVLGLSPKEYQILESILLAWPEAATRDRIHADVWGDKFLASADGEIKVYISRIRTKFKAVDPDFDAIATLNQTGYFWGHLPTRVKTLGPLSLLFPFHNASWNGQQIQLSSWESEVLTTLMRRHLNGAKRYLFFSDESEHTFSARLSFLNTKFKPYTHGKLLVIASPDADGTVQLNPDLFH